MKNFLKKGSITVEAAIILPVYIIVVMSFAYIIKVYYTNEIIQNALTGTCREMSTYSLLYYETNAEEIISGIEKFSNSNTVKDALGDDWLSANVQRLGREATDYLRTQLALIPAAKLLFIRQLDSEYDDMADEKLSQLSIKNGIEGFDFSSSKMLADGKSIDVAVVYEMKFPFLSNVLPGVKIKQVASACIWAGEDGVWSSASNEEDIESVWDMPNIKRGREIRKLQGANLPFNFPTVAKFENGTAISIKSLNIDEDYYGIEDNLKLKIVEYINKLDEFNGGKCGEVSITENDILKKELLLIIPETDLSAGKQMIINECKQIAARKGIVLEVVKAYGKQGNSSSDKSNDQNVQEK